MPRKQPSVPQTRSAPTPMAASSAHVLRDSVEMDMHSVTVRIISGISILDTQSKQTSLLNRLSMGRIEDGNVESAIANIK